MPSLHERAKDLFLDALNQPDTERLQYVADRCGEDTALRAEVESLLDHHDTTERERSRGQRTGTSTIDFQPGDVFAGRYRMITRIGRGGMGDVWKADDLVLKTPVALKLIHSAGDDARARIVNEVRLARQITHPAVCRVFDVGEDQGRVFLSMELVQGGDLATLLRHAGRLPSEKVVDIGRQLCEGLAAAHARNVLHRDLKPANVLVDDEGRVRITDFGIAISPRDTPEAPVAGTPRYMAPEQMTPGAPLSERTDIYAVGVILYELVAGQHPFARAAGSNQLQPLSARVPDVPPRLERAIIQALSTDPASRPASALEMAAMLPSPAAGRATWPRAWVAGVAAAVAVAILAVAWSFYAPGGSRLGEQDSIVVADFINTTGEPVFDGTLKVALAVALEQSPFLKVFPDDRMRETLRLMDRPTDGPITPAIAREIAQREQIKALISGSIARLGRNFVLALEATNAATGDVMAREQVETAQKEDVLSALGGAVSRLRGKLGESLASIQKFDAPLARATTPSLEALHAYSMALDEGPVNLRLDAIPHLRRALELDPDFALALALMATVYSNAGQTAQASEYARKAFELRDRVSERERFIVGFRYYRDATQEWDKALELAQLWTETYPREPFAFNSLGIAHINFGRWDAAIAALKRAVDLDQKFAAAYGNLSAALMISGRSDEAKSVLKVAAGHGINSALTRRITYLIATMEGDRATAARMFESSIGVGQTNAAYGWEGRSLAFEGRFGEAHETFRRGLQLAVQAGFREVASQLVLSDAEMHAMVGQCTEATDEVPGGLDLGRDNFALERAARVLALCGREGEASLLVRELHDRYPLATLTVRLSAPLATAAIALGRGDTQRALELLETLRLYDHAPRSEYWIPYLRGQAHLRLKDGQAARQDFQSILANRGENPNSLLYPLARLGLARAAALAGDVATARQAYEEFLAAWPNADDNLQPLKDAREQLAALPSLPQ
jgi:serine/threonine protein kinase/tetratricopeptide (TPR) repeat protein